MKPDLLILDGNRGPSDQVRKLAEAHGLSTQTVRTSEAALEVLNENAPRTVIIVLASYDDDKEKFEL
ncbi:MAG: hypothetical protein R3200_08645, partial [Xanthomonadales bacterium]|nr:hypothetical protein [Xanthomonadales bacterium]